MERSIIKNTGISTGSVSFRKLWFWLFCNWKILRITCISQVYRAEKIEWEIILIKLDVWDKILMSLYLSCFNEAWSWAKSWKTGSG